MGEGAGNPHWRAEAEPIMSPAAATRRPGAGRVRSGFETLAARAGFLGMRLFAVLLLSTFAFAQGRGGDPWERMSRFDADGDGKVSKEEFRGPARVFERFDADADGFVTEAEVTARRSGRGPDAAAVLKQVDSDGDGAVSPDEWSAWFEKHDENGDERLDAGELRAALGGTSYRDGAPEVGAPAPPIRAVRRETGETVERKRFDKPTVLVFGSWT